MPALDVLDLKPRKKAPDERQDIVCHVVALCPPYKQGGPIIAGFVGVFEWEITHMIQARGERLDGYAQPQGILTR